MILVAGCTECVDKDLNVTGKNVENWYSTNFIYAFLYMVLAIKTSCFQKVDIII